MFKRKVEILIGIYIFLVFCFAGFVIALSLSFHLYVKSEKQKASYEYYVESLVQSIKDINIHSVDSYLKASCNRLSSDYELLDETKDDTIITLLSLDNILKSYGRHNYEVLQIETKIKTVTNSSGIFFNGVWYLPKQTFEYKVYHLKKKA